MSLSSFTTRCRELDCVRAYFYLSVVDYIKDTFSSAAKTLDNSIPHFNDNSNNPTNVQAEVIPEKTDNLQASLSMLI